MTKVTINKLKMVVFFSFVIFALPIIAYANPIVTVDLYTPFSSSIVGQNILLWLFFVIGVGILIELFIIFLFVKKYINKEQKKKAILKIFVPVIVLNLFTMFIIQVLAMFFAFFAEVFPIVVESIIVYLIFKKANKNNLLTTLISKKDIIIMIFLANLLSFFFGFLVNITYSKCEYSYFDLMEMDGNYESIPSYCSYLPVVKEIIEEDKIKVNKVIEERRYEESIVDECDKREDKTNCYIGCAIKDDNVDLCYFAEDKDVCYREFAMRTLDDMACGKIKINNRDKSNMISCYYDLAIAMKIAGKEFEENCASIRRLRVGTVTENLKLAENRCYQLKEIEIVDYEKCEKRKDKTDCYVECAIKDNNIGLCYFTEDKDVCYRKFAVKTLDPMVCEKIKIKHNYANTLDIANCYCDVAVGRKVAGKEYKNICSSVEEWRDEAKKLGVRSTEKLELIINKCYQLEKDE